MNDDELLHTPSFSKLAAVCDCDRGSLRGIRDRDPRFPRQTAQGWSAGAVKLFLYIRELEKLTDSDYRDHCAEMEMSPPGPGARLAMIEFLWTCIEKFQAIGNR